MSRRLFGVLGIVLMLFFVTGCATPPEEQQGQQAQAQKEPPPKFKEMQKHELVVKTSQSGEKRIALKETPVMAEEPAVERSPNVRAVSRVTSLEGQEIRDLAISPDGRFLTFAMLNPQKVWNIYSVSSRGTGGVIRNTDSNYHTINPSFGTDTAGNVYIYYASNRMDEPRFHIWRVNSGRPFGVTRITWGRSSESYPYASPVPGGPVLYASKLEGAGESQVWMINQDGTLPTQLRDGEQPSFSPDGEWIVFTRKDQVTKISNIWIMKKDGSNLSQITFHSKDWEAKAIKKERKQSYVAKGKNAKGKEKVVVTTLVSASHSKIVGDVHPHWSPDGTRIVFASDRGRDYYGRHNMDIWMINCDGSNLTQLTTNGSDDDYPVWDPSGNYVYFISNRGFEWNVWRLDVGNAGGMEQPSATAKGSSATGQ